MLFSSWFGLSLFQHIGDHCEIKVLGDEGVGEVRTKSARQREELGIISGYNKRKRNARRHSTLCFS